MTEEGTYTLNLSDEAKADLKRLDKAVAERVLKKLDWLRANASIANHSALTGEFSGLYRQRVGDYRIIYALDREARLIVVARIGHRRDIYDV